MGWPLLFPPILHNPFKVLLTPAEKGVHVGEEGFAEVGDGVLRFGRHVGEQLPADEAVGGELLEHLRQDFFGNGRDIAIQFVEAYRFVFGNLYENRQRPFVAEPFEHRGSLAISVV